MMEFCDTISNYGVITGVLIQDNTMSKNEFRYLCTVGHEELFLFCLDRNDQCHLCSKPKDTIFQVPYWKTAASLLQLIIGYAHNFEALGAATICDYLWLKSFAPQNIARKSLKQPLTSIEESMQFHEGIVVSLQDFMNHVRLMELLNKEEKLYTALSLLSSSFEQHSCCLICELGGADCYHEHKVPELPIWQHVAEIPKLELAVIQACRATEAILGEPPKRDARGKVVRFIDQWQRTLGWSPEEVYEKAGKTYLDFYYELFFSLRNPSAHSRGNVHYELERTRTIIAQCFAFQVFESYLREMVKSF